MATEDEIQAEMFRRGLMEPEEKQAYVSRENPWGPTAWTWMKDKLIPKTEDWPEAYQFSDYDRVATEPHEDKMKKIRVMYPNATPITDQWGNEAFIPGETIEGRAPDAPMYFNKPGFSPNDARWIKAVAWDVAPALIASSASAGLAGIKGGLEAMTRVGGATFVTKSVKNLLEGHGLAGVKEAASDAGEEAIAEGGGRVLSYMLAPALKAAIFTYRKLTGTGKLPADAIIDSTGELTGKAKVILEQQGMTVDDFLKATKENFKTEMEKSLGYTGEAAQAAAEAAQDMATQARMAAAAKIGTKLTKGEAERDFSQMQMENYLSKQTGTKAGDMIRNFEAERNKTIWDFGTAWLDKIGGEKYPIKAGMNAKEALKKIDMDMSKQVSALAKTAMETHGIQYPIPDKSKQAFMGLLDQMEHDHTAQKLPMKLINGVRKRLERYGVGGKGKEQLTVERLYNDIRKYVTDEHVVYSKTPSGRRAMRQVKDFIDDTLRQAAEGTEAANAFDAMRKAKVDWGNVMDQKDVVAALVKKKAWHTDVIPDDVAFNKIILEGNTSEPVRKVKAALLRKGKAEGKAAWRDLQTSTGEYILKAGFGLDATKNAAATPVMRNIMDMPVFSRARMEAAIKRIGQEKLKVIFRPDQMETLMALNKAAAAFDEIPGTINPSGTAQEIMNGMQRLLNNIPGGRLFSPVISGTIDMVAEQKNKAFVRTALNPEGPMARTVKRDVKKIRRVLPGLTVGLVGVQQEE